MNKEKATLDCLRIAAFSSQLKFRDAALKEGVGTGPIFPLQSKDPLQHSSDTQ